MLQVENVFNLQVIGEGKDSQLNLKWVTLDEKKNVEDYCEGCGTEELRKNIISLVSKLMGKTLNNKVVVEEKNNQQNTTSTIKSSNYNTSSIGISFSIPIFIILSISAAKPKRCTTRIAFVFLLIF